MTQSDAIAVAEILRRHPDAFSGGARLLPVQTTHGRFNVWTNRSGDNPRIKLLLLHGEPGCTHEYFEAFDSYLPRAGVECELGASGKMAQWDRTADLPQIRVPTLTIGAAHEDTMDPKHMAAMARALSCGVPLNLAPRLSSNVGQYKEFIRESIRCLLASRAPEL